MGDGRSGWGELQVFVVSKLIIMYEDQLGSNGLMVPSLSVSRRSWRDSLHLVINMFYLYMTKNLLIFFAIYMHMHLFAPLTTCVLPK